MRLPYKEKIIELFNLGKLGIADARWYTSRGFAFVCNDGQVTDIVREEV